MKGARGGAPGGGAEERAEERPEKRPELKENNQPEVVGPYFSCQGPGHSTERFFARQI